MWGYRQFIEEVADPSHPGHDEYLERAGGEFDPGAFNLEDVDARLRRMGRGRSAESSNPSSMEERQPVKDQVDLVSSWPQALSVDQRVALENLPLCRDRLTLLTYLRDNWVAGTQATGNLPLKAEREVAAGFVNPPMLEEVMRNHVIRVHSE